MLSQTRFLSFALRTTAIGTVVLLLGADPADACHKRRTGQWARPAMAQGCATVPVGHGMHQGGHAAHGGVMGAGYTSIPMASHQGVGAHGAGMGYSYGTPAMTGYGSPQPTQAMMGRGMVGQAIAGPGRMIGGVGRGITGGFGGAQGMGMGMGMGMPGNVGYGGMGYGAPGTFGGVGAPGTMGGMGYGAPGTMGGVGTGVGAGMGTWGY